MPSQQGHVEESNYGWIMITYALDTEQFPITFWVNYRFIDFSLFVSQYLQNKLCIVRGVAFCDLELDTSMRILTSPFAV